MFNPESRFSSLCFFSSIVESEHAKNNPQDRTFKPRFSNVDMEGGLKTNSVDVSSRFV